MSIDPDQANLGVVADPADGADGGGMIAAKKDRNFSGCNGLSAQFIGAEAAFADEGQPFLQAGVGQGIVTGDGDVAAVKGRISRDL